MSEHHPIQDLMNGTMEKIKSMIDANTVVGTPITTPDGTTVIPVSRVTFGFGSGGTDFQSRHSKETTPLSFGGGGAAGGAVGAVDYDLESLYLALGAAHYMLYVSADHLLAVAADVAYAVVGLEHKLLGVVDVVLYLVLYIVR